jgi:hypothetical protein
MTTAQRRSGVKSTTSSDLYDAAMAAKAAVDTAAGNVQSAAQVLQQAQATLAQANQNFHDDLVQNGTWGKIDNSVTPAQLIICTPVDPDSWSSITVRTE